MDNGEVDGSEGSQGMDLFGRIAKKQHELLDSAKVSLILQIRSLSGFEIFLTSSSFDTVLLLRVDRLSSLTIPLGVPTSSFSSMTLFHLLLPLVMISLAARRV